MLVQSNATTIPLKDKSVQCIITSPPYYGLRDYGVDGQIGLETSMQGYIANIVGVFGELHRVLKDDGVAWLNLGDSYCGGSGGIGGSDKQRSNVGACDKLPTKTGLKPKDLMLIPHRVAIALQEWGWYVRQDIVWAKPAPMPESVTDRCTKAHEYVFMLTKKERYYYDAEAIREPMKECSIRRAESPFLHERRVENGPLNNRFNPKTEEAYRDKILKGGDTGANKRSVWTIPTRSYSEAHFATFPEALVIPPVLCSSRRGDTVLDPFCGSGTVGAVCKGKDRRFVGLDLNAEYLQLAQQRIGNADFYQYEIFEG